MYGIKIDELWDWLKEGDENRDIMTCGTSGNGDDTKQNRVGLAMSHAYTVLGVVEVNDRTYNKSERLVKLRNPWGKETYKGPWCDSCHEWTDETEKQAGLQHEVGAVSEDIRAIEDQCCEAGSEREVRLSGVVQLQQKAKWYQALK